MSWPKAKIYHFTTNALLKKHGKSSVSYIECYFKIQKKVVKMLDTVYMIADIW